MTARTLNLIAVVLADGSLDKKRYTVSFTEDKELVDHLIGEFKEIEEIKLNWKVDVQFNSTRARVYSKKLVQLLQQFIEETRTRPYNVHPRSPTKRSNSYPHIILPKECFIPENSREFLRYYISCDGGPEFSVYKRSSGSIQIHYGIKIGCKNPWLKKQIKKLLNLFQIKANEKENGLVIRDLNSIKIFKEKIGFLEESKIRRGKLFQGFRKNDVIKLIVLCGFLTSKSNWINKNFNSINELKNFLLTCLNLIKDNKLERLKKFLSKSFHISVPNIKL